MDQSEVVAHRYLQSLKLGNFEYEPDGNVPPDFALTNRIAVEVRRLDQSFQEMTGAIKSLEEVEIPFRQRLKRLLGSFDPSTDDKNWYVGYRLRRPLEPWNLLQPKIAEALRTTKSSSIHLRSKSTRISEHLVIDFLRSDKPRQSTFVLGASIDEDSGGWLMSETDRNVRRCIAEKERKVAPYRARYSEWWLVLVDQINHGIDVEDEMDYRLEVFSKIKHSFARLVLLDPRSTKRAFVV